MPLDIVKFNKLYSDVCTTMTNGKKQPQFYRNMPVLNALKQAFENLKAINDALPGVLNDTYLVTLGGVINDLSRVRSPQTLSNIQDRIDIFVTSLPYFNGAQVTSSRPNFIIADNAGKDDVTLTVQGQFPPTGDARTSSLDICGKNFLPEDARTDMLRFKIPLHDFDNKTRSTAFYKGVLAVPLMNQPDAKFSVLVGAWSPVAARVSLTFNIIEREFQKHSKKMHIDSCRGTKTCEVDAEGFITGSVGGRNDDEKEHGEFWHFIARRTPGWNIVTNSPGNVFHVTYHDGSVVWPSLVTHNEDRIVVKARTRTIKWGTSGEMDFTIDYSEYRDVSKTIPTPDVSDVIWKVAHRKFTLPPTWDKNSPINVKVTAFDGNTYDWSDKNPVTIPFVRIELKGNQLITYPLRPQDL